MRNRIFTLLFVLALGSSAWGQQAPAVETPPQSAGEEETVRVSHRVVFLDALVRDKRTNAHVGDLKEENFEVVADGRPRKLAYFTREGDAGRRPLALTLVLDLRRDGAGRYLRRTDIMEAMAAELSKLPPQDEVSVVVLASGRFGGKRQWLAAFTRNRAQVASALSLVPSLVAAGNSGPPSDPSDHDDGDTPAEGPTFSATVGGGDKKEGETGPRVVSVKEGDAESDIESEIKMVGKDGSTVTRTVYKNGRVHTRRVSKDGEVSTEMNDAFDIAGTVHEVVRRSGRERPNSRAALVWVSDGIVPVFYVERDVAVAELTMTNVTFNALVTDMKFGFKLFKPVLKPLGNFVGLSIYGGSQHIAKETGGEALRVDRPADYANGLGKIIGSLTGRYSLGFRLDDDERGDEGHLRPLEVRVRARDAKGKERKLTVVTRSGYYLPRDPDAKPPAPAEASTANKEPEADKAKP